MWFDAGLRDENDSWRFGVLHRSCDVRVAVTHLSERKTEHLDRVVLLAVTSKLFCVWRKTHESPSVTTTRCGFLRKNGTDVSTQAPSCGVAKSTVSVLFDSVSIVFLMFGPNWS